VRRVATAAYVRGAVVGEVAENAAVDPDAIQVQALGETCSFGDCRVWEGMQPGLDWHVARVDRRESRAVIERECSDSIGACSFVVVDHSSCVCIRLAEQKFVGVGVARKVDYGRQTSH